MSQSREHFWTEGWTDPNSQDPSRHDRGSSKRNRDQKTILKNEAIFTENKAL